MAGSVCYVVPAPDSRPYLFLAPRRRRSPARRRSRRCTPSRGWHAHSRASIRPVDASPAVAAARTAADSAASTSRNGRATAASSTSCKAAASTPSRSPPPAAATPPARRAAGRGGGRGGRGGDRGRSRRIAQRYGPRRIAFSVRMQIDRPAERRQVFEEAWRIMKNRFYDPKMHGVNWAAAKDNYEPCCPTSPTPKSCTT